jgi:hypothetical protein
LKLNIDFYQQVWFTCQDEKQRDSQIAGPVAGGGGIAGKQVGQLYR